MNTNTSLPPSETVGALRAQNAEELAAFQQAQEVLREAGLSTKERFFLLLEEGAIDGPNEPDGVAHWKIRRLFGPMDDQPIAEDDRNALIAEWRLEVEAMSPAEREAALKVVTTKLAVKQALAELDKAMGAYNASRYEQLSDEKKKSLRFHLEDKEFEALIETGRGQDLVPHLDSRLGRPNFFL